jgi:hypothetical protein
MELPEGIKPIRRRLRRPCPSQRREHWCRRWDSSPQDPLSENEMSANCITTALLEPQTGFEPASSIQLPYSCFVDRVDTEACLFYSGYGLKVSVNSLTNFQLENIVIPEPSIVHR